MLVAQISDFHVALPDSPTDRKHQTAVKLERAVAQLGRLDPGPDVVLCTGDLVQDGEAAEYRRLVPLLERLTMPWYTARWSAASRARSPAPARAPAHRSRSTCDPTAR